MLVLKIIIRCLAVLVICCWWRNRWNKKATST